MKISTASIVLTALLGSTAVAQSAEIAVFTKNKVDPFFEEARVGADVAAKSLGYQTVQYAPTRPNNFRSRSPRSRTRSQESPPEWCSSRSISRV